MRTIIQLLIFVLSFSVTSYGQLEKVVIEKYYISDLNDATDVTGGGIAPGSTTYRIYLDLKPNSRLIGLYGDANHPFKISSTEIFFNNVSDGQTFAKDIVKARYGENTMALDTWLTLGQTVKKQGPITYFGVPKSADDNGSFIGGINNDGGSQAIASGLLINEDPQIGIPLVLADGMDTLNYTPSGWTSTGILDFVTGEDHSIFGSLSSPLTFESANFQFTCSGVYGVVPDTNQVLIAQLTTVGELSFTLNAIVEELVDGNWITKNYVGVDSLLGTNEVFNPYMNYPYQCGCTDPQYIEYNSNFICSLEGACQTLARIGCLDSMACNYDPTANVHIQDLCCYPGMCAGRNIVEVCPDLIGEDFEFRIYPVPTEDRLNVNIVSGLQGEITYAIYNSYGSIMSSGITQQASNINISLDVSAFNVGIYQVQVRSGNQVKNQLFLKL